MPTTYITNQTQQTTPSDHLVRSVSKVLAGLEPDLYPLDTLLRRMKAGEKPASTKHEWGQVASIPRVDTIATANNAGGAGAAQTVYFTGTVPWRVDDTFIDLSSTSSPIMWVSALSGNTATVYALGVRSSNSGLGTVPAMAVGTQIMWIGNAKQEGGTYSSSRAAAPFYDYNFCEISDAVVKISETRKATRNYTAEHDWTRIRRDNLKEFRRSLEYKHWFGKYSETIDPNTSELRWTMNGVTQYITKTLSYDKDVVGSPKITESMIIDWLVSIFSGNNGSTSRFLFADSYLAGEIMKVPLVNLRSRELTQVLGVKVERLTFNFGDVYLKHHRGFNEAGKNHYGVVLDLEHVTKHDLRAMEKRPLKLVEQGVDCDAEQYIEQSTVSITHYDSHAIIQGE
jgi:hypothetical protein